MENIELTRRWVEHKSETKILPIVDGLEVVYYNEGVEYYGTVTKMGEEFYIVWDDGVKETLISESDITFNRIKDYLGFKI